MWVDVGDKWINLDHVAVMRRTPERNRYEFLSPDREVLGSVGLGDFLDNIQPFLKSGVR